MSHHLTSVLIHTEHYFEFWYTQLKCAQMTKHVLWVSQKNGLEGTFMLTRKYSDETFPHRLHRKLRKGPFSVQPVVKISLKLHFRFTLVGHVTYRKFAPRDFCCGALKQKSDYRWLQNVHVVGF